MKQLLEEMVWCWIQYVMMQEFTGQPNTHATHAAILAEADKRCLVPLRDAGIITVWKLSLTANKGQTMLFVDLSLPENIASMQVAKLA